MDNTKVVEKLNAILRWEWTGLAQYAQYGYVVHGLWRETYAGMFHSSAEECFRHANQIAAKIVALGGVPTIERGKVNQTNDLEEMLGHSLAFEQEAVNLYTSALKMELDDPLRVLLEDLVLEEQDGVDELSKILGEKAGAAAPAKPSASKTA